MTTNPRFPDVDPSWAESMLRTYEERLRQHSASVPTAPPERLAYAWNALAGDYREIALLEYAAGAPIENCRDFLVKGAKAHLEVVKIRGTGSHRNPLSPGVQFGDDATGNSCSTADAICIAMTAADWQLALDLAPYVWDPPTASYIGPTSVLCTSNQQTAALLLRDYLMENVDGVISRLRAVHDLDAPDAGGLLMIEGIATESRVKLAAGFRRLLAVHAATAARAENYRVPEHFLCIPALGLAALALLRGTIKRDDLPRDNPHFPPELIADPGRPFNRPPGC
jgi:hypothetical protein